MNYKNEADEIPFLAGMMWLSMPVMAQKITSKKRKTDQNC